MPKPSAEGNNMSRKSFLGKLGILAATAALTPEDLLSQSTQEKIARTGLTPTTEKFKNGECVYTFKNEKGERLGEFWPIHGLNLVTRDTFPKAFEGSIEDVQKKLGDKNIVATTPDGMTGGSVGSYKMEGKSLSNGIPCGDGEIKNYGIVTVRDGFNIEFTHKQEHLNDFDSYYASVQKDKGTLFFLPSIYRDGKSLPSQKEVDKVLVRRSVPKGPQTPNGVQMAVIIFDAMTTCDNARKAVLGLDRPGASSTTHIYVLDGGSTWGQSAKEVNGQVVTKGTRNPEVITNYLVFY